MVHAHEKYGLIAKRVDVCIFIPGQKAVKRTAKAKPGQWITENGIQGILEREEAMLAKHLPQIEFRLVQLAPNRFNLIGAKRSSEADSFPMNLKEK